MKNNIQKISSIKNSKLVIHIVFTEYISIGAYFKKIRIKPKPNLCILITVCWCSNNRGLNNKI